MSLKESVFPGGYKLFKGPSPGGLLLPFPRLKIKTNSPASPPQNSFSLVCDKRNLLTAGNNRALGSIRTKLYSGLGLKSQEGVAEKTLPGNVFTFICTLKFSLFSSVKRLVQMHLRLLLLGFKKSLLSYILHCVIMSKRNPVKELFAPRSQCAQQSKDALRHEVISMHPVIVLVTIFSPSQNPLDVGFCIIYIAFELQGLANSWVVKAFALLGMKLQRHLGFK